MEIKINDETVSLDHCVSLKEVLSLFGYSDKKIAVALNNEFIPKELHESVLIQQYDMIDIIIPMQGG